MFQHNQISPDIILKRRVKPVRRLALLAGAVLLVLLTLSVTASAGDERADTANAGSRPAGKVLLVVIDRIGLKDLTGTTTPNIMKLVKRGGVSLMNARVRNDSYGEGGYLEIGAGGRAIGGPNLGLAFNSGERLKTPDGGYIYAGQLYRSRTGRSAPPGSVVNPYIEEMKKRSDVPQATSSPGLLGKALTEGGRKVSVLGNADSLAPAPQIETTYQVDQIEPLQQAPATYRTVTMLHRESSCIAMDEAGQVRDGDVSADLYRKSASAAGIKTDFHRLVDEARSRLESSDVVVVDMGQTTRVDEQAGFYSEAALEKARREALKGCDGALGDLLNSLDISRDMVVVCVPTPTRKMLEDGDLLTPLVIAGPGFRAGVRLESPTTRRVGLVSNFDIAPTVLEAVGLEVPPEMDGRALSASNAGSDLPGLLRFNERAAGTSSTRRTMVRVYAISAIALLALFFVVALIREDLLGRHRYLWSLVLLALLCGPLAFLVVPVFGVPALYWLVPAAVGASILLALAALLTVVPSRAVENGSSAYSQESDDMKLRVFRPLFFLSGLTFLALLVDTFAGSPLMTFSAFGSDVMMADRYYGIGNLYMGFMVGSALLFACLFPVLFAEALDKPWKRYAVCGSILAVTAFAVGFGRLGANMGGLLTALAGLTVALAKLQGGKIGLKRAALIVLIIVLCVGVMLAADLLLPGASSHAGKAVEQTSSGGASAFWQQLNRKLAADWFLTFTSTWRLVLLVVVVAGLVLNWKYRLFLRIRQKTPVLYAGLLGMGVAMPVALLFNDSGIESAAAISIFLFIPCFLMLSWTSRPDSTPSANDVGGD
jgi:hypothetical protein